MTGRKRATWLLAEALQGALPDEVRPDEWLADAWAADPLRELTRSRTTDTAVIDLAGLGPAVRKRWRWPGVREQLKGVGRTTALARTPAEREFAALGRSYAAHAPFHPRPLAAWIERGRSLATAAMLLLELVDDAVDLAMFLRDEGDAGRRRAVLADLAAKLAAMHDAGVTDGDCHARNVLVQPAEARTWKVDCGRQRMGRAPATGRRTVYDLACLDVAFERFASDEERARFLERYLAGRGAAPDHGDFSRRLAAFRERIAPEESRRLPPRRDE
jgi:tRNA A-37 threonylcarbamoyl transferase component Bud32